MNFILKANKKMNEKIKSELIHIGAVLIRCHYIPSDSVDDYAQKTYSAARVAQMMKKARLQSLELGVQIKRLADSLHT
jgi:hypothetical protein